MNRFSSRRDHVFTNILIVATIFSFAFSFPGQDQSQNKLKALAIKAAGHEGSAFMRTQRIVRWMKEHFEWSYLARSV